MRRDVFGVCNYDFKARNPSVEDLICFDSFDKAFTFYIEKIMSDKTFPYYFDDTLWIVYIKDNHIEQFEQLATKTKTAFVQLNNT